ncbi:histone lysine demethylase PHF8-like, partial [Leucoraja erinacea]|uniref:histone lysine demethylase PHF8-like n=1 Tax=Leucoraja erinaceus TaxID=7782 RepID=UPI0024586359
GSPGEVDFDIVEDDSSDEDSAIDIDIGGGEGAVEGLGGGSAAGILDLLKASKEVGALEYTAQSQPPASPSTQEAIQGMLCMANLQAVSSPGSSSLQAWWSCGQERAAGPSVAATAAAAGKRGRGRGEARPEPRGSPSPDSPASADDSYDDQDSLGACFKDSDYVYPSLESDEEDPSSRARNRKRRNSDDVPWNPKGRSPPRSVAPTLPRHERPVREGTRVASIETGLAAAAAKLAQQEQQKVQKKKSGKKKPPPVAEEEPIAKPAPAGSPPPAHRRQPRPRPSRPGPRCCWAAWWTTSTRRAPAPSACPSWAADPRPWPPESSSRSAGPPPPRKAANQANVRRKASRRRSNAWERS